jgi:hypothetical protein
MSAGGLSGSVTGLLVGNSVPDRSAGGLSGSVTV